MEYLSVRCRPFYLPREFTVIIITAVYIPPDANIKTALDSLLTAISNQQCDHPDGVYVIAGDFNKANLKTVLPKFHQHVHCPTRGRNTLDHVYSNIKHGLKTSPLPHLGQSDHISLFLTPAYRPRICTSGPTTKVLQVWPEGASEQLRDCFSDTDWTIFEEDNIDTYTASVLFYIKCCMENITTTKQICVFPNNKPWMTRGVRLLLKTRNTAFQSGDVQQYKAARANLKRGIKDAKAAYKQKIEDLFSSSDPRRHGRGYVTSPGKTTPAALPAEVYWRRSSWTGSSPALRRRECQPPVQTPTARPLSFSLLMSPALSAGSTHGKQPAQMASQDRSSETVLQS